MSLPRFVRSLTRGPILFIIGALLLLWIITGSELVWLYGWSFAYHWNNLSVLIWRQRDVDDVIASGVVLRTIAWSILAVLAVMMMPTEIHPIAWLPIAIGTLLHAASVHALGLRRTYYWSELSQDEKPQSIRSFPYNLFRHPMAIGSLLQLGGLFWLVPEMAFRYPVLMIGHVGLTVLTAIIEQAGLRLKDYFFPAKLGRFTDPGVCRSIDTLCEWSLRYFKTELGQSCSMHRYIKNLPSEIRQTMDTVRFHDAVLGPIRAAFPNSKIIPLTMTDEIYISRYNIDNGGDQGLFDKHYDGNLRQFPGASVVRSLIYLSSEDKLEIVFDNSDVRTNMKTYDFGLLDFHKELHWVNGEYDPTKPPRILLKCNYYVDHWNLAVYRQFGIGVNLLVFYVVRAAMEYSKSPKTILQGLIGRLCNLFRRMNNLSPAIPMTLLATILAISLRMIVVSFADQ